MEDKTAGSHIVFARVYNLQMYLFTIRARYDLAMTLQSKVKGEDAPYLLAHPNKVIWILIVI